ncbi:MAG: phosphopantetheine-binding protein [Segniliparus sp.]|uniref:phosphopantetheine-binding protein n=1 Tax=Segniliparus sp. TaxID=2804064 RepID=UPI003F327296
MTDDVTARVLEVIGKLAPEPGRVVGPGDRLVDDLGYHSVRVVELIVELELEFGLPPIGEEDVSGLATAGELAALVADLAARRA